jgi:hypothetical protein
MNIKGIYENQFELSIEDKVLDDFPSLPKLGKSYG